MEFIKLLKLRLSSSVLFSSLAGYLLAIDEYNPHDSAILIKLLIGGFGIVACANGLNQVFEADTDALMDRTKNRPLPRKTITVPVALLFSLFLGIVGLFCLYLINLNCVIYSLVSLLIYVLGYTPMKFYSPLSGFIGAIPGAMPIMLGWLALRNEFGWEPGIFFAIQFIWQFPHFWAIAWVSDEDYKKAGFKLLPNGGGKNFSTAINIMTYTLILLPLGLLPTIFGITGLISGFVAILCGVLFLIQTIHLIKDFSKKSALRVMIGSFIYLPIVQISYILDKI